MYLLIEKPGVPPRRVEVEGDTALVGRAPHCDVLIDEEFVSKQHVRVMRGIVAVDLSTNGAFVDGERAVGGILVGSRPIRIGRSQITIRVEAEDRPATPDDTVEQTAAQARRALAEMAASVAMRSAARDPAAGDAEQARAELEGLRAENAALRARIEDLERNAETPAAPAAPADGSAASMLLFKLQRENAQLKRDLAAARAGPAAPAGAARPGQSAAVVSPPRPAGDSGVVPPARDAASLPASPAGSAAARVGGNAGGLARLGELVRLDADATAARPDEPLDSFLLVEGFRFLRRIERVVTRLAGGLIQLYQLHTMVPGVEGTMRDLLSDALAHPDHVAARESLLEYLRELGRWLVVALSAHRQAAEQFAVQLTEELSAERLSADDPIPAARRTSGKADAELWRRACQHLRALGPDQVAERLEKLAREAADRLADQDTLEAFS